jgi:cytochrome P450
MTCSLKLSRLEKHCQFAATILKDSSPFGQVLNKIPILPKVRGAVKAKNELNSIVYGLIKKRREELLNKGNEFNDLLTKLMEARDPDAPENVSDSAAGRMCDQQVRDDVNVVSSP